MLLTLEPNRITFWIPASSSQHLPSTLTSHPGCFSCRASQHHVQVSNLGKTCYILNALYGSNAWKNFKLPGVPWLSISVSQGSYAAPITQTELGVCSGSVVSQPVCNRGGFFRGAEHSTGILDVKGCTSWLLKGYLLPLSFQIRIVECFRHLITLTKAIVNKSRAAINNLDAFWY